MCTSILMCKEIFLYFVGKFPAHVHNEDSIVQPVETFCRKLSGTFVGSMFPACVGNMLPTQEIFLHTSGEGCTSGGKFSCTLFLHFNEGQKWLLFYIYNFYQMLDQHLIKI